MVLLAVFSDRLGRLSVVFGVAGAGIAFALQEVIVSVAGWAAVSFGSFYSVGDRIQLGGIKGDVIDIGVLRTTLAEVGQWVDGDLYNGRADAVCGEYAKESARIWARMQKRYPLEDAATAPLVTFVFDQNWVTFTVRYAVRFDRRRTTKHLLSSRVLEAIGKTQDTVSLASAAIEVVPKAPLDIRQLP